MKIKKLLAQIGISEKAAKIYIYLIESGTKSVREIAEDTNLNRSSSYTLLSELIESGLATSYDENGVTQYTAEPPLQLISNATEKLHKLEKQKEELNELSKKLERSKKEQVGKPVLRYFEGKKGVMKIFEDYLTIPSSGYLYEITNHELIRKYFLDELNIYNKKIREIGYSTKSISQGALRQQYSENIKTYTDSPIRSEINVYLNNVSFITLSDNSKSLIIEHKDIARTYEGLFLLAIK